MLLVLSNFSYATQQMLCLMSEETDIGCDCTCEQNDLSSGVILTNDSSPCCANTTNELSNTNNLQLTGNELPKDITSFATLYNNHVKDITFNSFFDNSFSALKEHIPKTDIPILISSLLI